MSLGVRAPGGVCQDGICQWGCQDNLYPEKTEQTVDLAGAAYLYRIRKIMPFLVTSDAPLASRQEALAAYKSGQAGLVIMLLGDELYPYEKKAIELK